MESSHFLIVNSLCAPLQNCFSSIFYLAPLNPKIYSPNFWYKIAYKSACMAGGFRRCLGLPRGFRGWPIQWNHAKCCGADHCCMATKFGLGAEIQSPTGLLDSSSSGVLCSMSRHGSISASDAQRRRWIQWTRRTSKHAFHGSTRGFSVLAYTVLMSLNVSSSLLSSVSISI